MRRSSAARPARVVRASLPALRGVLALLLAGVPGRVDSRVSAPSPVRPALGAGPAPAAASLAAGAGYALTLGPAQALLQTPTGQPLIDLLPELELKRVGQRRERQRWAALRAVGTDGAASGGWALQGELQRGGARYALRLTGDSAQATLTVELTVHHAESVGLEREALRFRALAAGGVAALDRGYRTVEDPRGPLFVDALTPHRLLLRGLGGEVTLIGSEGLQGFWLRPRGRGAYTLELELDDARNRPLARYRGCAAGRAPASSLASPARGARVKQEAALWRLAGTQRRYRWQWRLGAGPLPELRRYPSGYQAALVLTDHADQSSSERLEALAFGATGAVAAGRVGPQWPGLVNRGLVYSKTVFVRRVAPYAEQLDAAPYRALLSRMAQQGVELGLHSLSGGPDDPGDPATREAFAAFRQFSPGRVWIDHRPTTNCEAVSNRGADPASPWYILPLLQRFGLRYLWRGVDAPAGGRRTTLDLLRADRPAARPAVLYRAEQLALGGEQPFWLFSSSWLFPTQWQQFVAMLAPRALDRLEASHGLAIGHVYLETCRARGRLHGRELLRALGGQRYVLRPAVDRLFVALAQRQRAGTLWVTGIESLAEHLLGAMRVALEPVGHDGTVRLRYRREDGPALLRGMTLRWPPGVVGVLAGDGAALGGQRLREGRLETWLDLTAERPVTLRPRWALDPKQARPALVSGPDMTLGAFAKPPESRGVNPRDFTP